MLDKLLYKAPELIAARVERFVQSHYRAWMDLVIVVLLQLFEKIFN